MILFLDRLIPKAGFTDILILTNPSLEIFYLQNSLLPPFNVMRFHNEVQIQSGRGRGHITLILISLTKINNVVSFPETSPPWLTESCSVYSTILVGYVTWVRFLPQGEKNDRNLKKLRNGIKTVFRLSMTTHLLASLLLINSWFWWKWPDGIFVTAYFSVPVFSLAFKIPYEKELLPSLF